jgi:hypothetical protein
MSDTSGSSAKGGPLTAGDVLARKAISLALRALTSVTSTVTTIVEGFFTGARAWADNALAVPIPAGETVLLAGVGFIPRQTGDFQVIVSGVVTNTTSETPGTAQLIVQVNSVPTYTQAPMNLQGEAQNAMALVVNLDELTPPVVLPIGVVANVTIGLAATGADMSVAPHGVQVEVEEKLWPQ